MSNQPDKVPPCPTTSLNPIIQAEAAFAALQSQRQERVERQRVIFTLRRLLDSDYCNLIYRLWSFRDAAAGGWESDDTLDGLREELAALFLDVTAKLKQIGADERWRRADHDAFCKWNFMSVQATDRESIRPLYWACHAEAKRIVDALMEGAFTADMLRAPLEREALRDVLDAVFFMLDGVAGFRRFHLKDESESGDSPSLTSTRATERDGTSVDAKGQVESQAGEQPPDGPFEPDGFRFGTAVVRFGGAAKEYRVLKALWDKDKQRPFETRTVEDVMCEVYGEDHDTDEKTFRKMVSTVRGRLATEHFPLAIPHICQGQLRLVRV